MLYPFAFQPIFKERVWGGRLLESRFRKAIPDGHSIGESWEITDRIHNCSVIVNGNCAGKDIHWLILKHEVDLLGTAKCLEGRFPLLCKILDSSEKLSLQVHPPATLAKALGGQAKTEMWYIAHADPEADIYAGLRKSITLDQFARALQAGNAAECVYRLPIQSGDSMFIPSGRVHGLGAGNLIFEIQQNSDTTYRVFDWNRLGLDGKPRDLHIDQALRCIDFEDVEPQLIRQTPVLISEDVESISLVNCDVFDVDLYQSQTGGNIDLKFDSCLVVASVCGKSIIEHPTEPLTLPAGSFGLIPACLRHVEVKLGSQAKLLVAKPH